jgi:hypothetical protein
MRSCLTVTPPHYNTAITGATDDIDGGQRFVAGQQQHQRPAA